MNSIAIKTPLGKLYITEKDGFIVRISFTGCEEGKETDILNLAKVELEEYFDKKRKNFTFPISFSSTEYREKIWKALMEVEYGKTISYSTLGNKAGFSTGARSVGGAVHNNPLLIVIPCHRVIGKDGSMTGFGEGVDKKVFLLKLEGAKISL